MVIGNGSGAIIVRARTDHQPPAMVSKRRSKTSTPAAIAAAPFPVIVYIQAGVTSHAVASALGHTSFTTTARSYAKPEAVASAKQQRVIGMLSGANSANQNGGEPLDDEKLNNLLHNFSAFSPSGSKGGLSN